MAGESTFYIDTTIVNPACHSYVSTLWSDVIEIATAEDKKRANKYSPYFATQVPSLDINKLIPFVIETCGKFGIEGDFFWKKLKL
jgi:hypothetical protein